MPDIMTSFDNARQDLSIFVRLPMGEKSSFLAGRTPDGTRAEYIARHLSADTIAATLVQTPSAEAQAALITPALLKSLILPTHQKAADAIFNVIENLPPQTQASLWKKLDNQYQSADVGYLSLPPEIAVRAMNSVGKLPAEIQADIYATSPFVRDITIVRNGAETRGGYYTTAPAVLENITKLPTHLQVKSLTGPDVLQSLTDSGRHSPTTDLFTRHKSESAMAYIGNWTDNHRQGGLLPTSHGMAIQARHTVAAIKALAQQVGADGIEPVFASPSVQTWLNAGPRKDVEYGWLVALGSNAPPSLLKPPASPAGTPATIKEVATLKS